MNAFIQKCVDPHSLGLRLGFVRNHTFTFREHYDTDNCPSRYLAQKNSVVASAKTNPTHTRWCDIIQYNDVKNCGYFKFQHRLLTVRMTFNILALIITIILAIKETAVIFRLFVAEIAENCTSSKSNFVVKTVCMQAKKKKRKQHPVSEIRSWKLSVRTELQLL